MELRTMTSLQNTLNQAIPVYFDEETFDEFILPILWVGSRGPEPKLSLYKFFHYILYVLYTGIQWKMLPIGVDENGQPEIHYSRVWNKWKQWVEHGCIVAIFYQSVLLLKEQGQLDLRILHGDGSNTVAKKGANVSITTGINTRKVTNVFQFLITLATCFPQ
jgi:hypothetical protein